MVILCYFEKKDYKKPVDEKKHVEADIERLEAESTAKNKTFSKMKNKTHVDAISKIREELAKKKHAKKEKVDKEFELLEIRQIIYAKLSQGMQVDSMLRTFTMKVEQYLMKYRRSLTDIQEKSWKEKVSITEKAVVKAKIKELKTRCKVPAGYEDEVNADVEDMIEEARVDEVAAEKLPEPPAEDADDEEAKKVKMKRPNKKRRRKKVKGKIDKLRRIKFEKLGMDELLGKNLVMPKYVEDEDVEINSVENIEITEVLSEDLDASDDNHEGVQENKVEVKLDEVDENKVKVEVDELLDKKKEVEEKEIEVFDVRKCDENKLDDENFHDALEKLEVKDEYYENPRDGKVTIQGEEKETKKHLLGGDGKNDVEVKGMDSLMLVPLLQANLAVMLLCVKTLHEQSSRPSSMSSSLQPMASLSNAQCPCLTQSRMCGKATKAITGMGTEMSSTGMVKRLISKFDTGKLQ